MPARIFVLENDRASRELFQVLVKAWGHEVSVAGDGEEAKRILSREPAPDLIIADLQLTASPGATTGYDVAEWCRKQSHLASIPILCCTATMRWYDPDRVRASGFSTVIPKPIVPETFMFQVEFYLPPERRGYDPRSEAYGREPTH